MNRPRMSLIRLLTAAATAPLAFSAPRQSLPLDSGWEFRQTAPADGSTPTAWHPAQVPGDVHLDLVRNQLIPDPFYRDNEAKLQWIEKADWEYRTTLTVSPELLERRHLELVFDGLDAYGTVSLNGQQVLTADNMFRTWRVDAKPGLKAGANTLVIDFPSPLAIAARIAAGDPWRAKIGTAKRPTSAKPPTSTAGTGDPGLSPAASGGRHGSRRGTTRASRTSTSASAT